ncbi:hypothetical protein GCM10027067_15410 [Pseudactinotalea suaedae]
MVSEDESLRRLRAADPAQGRPTDLAALRRAVDTRLSDETPAAAAPASVGTDELAARRPRRPRRMAWVAGAAASVIVGVSGYLVGVGSLDRAGGADGSAEDADPLMASEEAAGGDSAGQTDMDGGAIEDSGAGTQSELTMLAGGRVMFVASGLSSEPGSAEAFAYDPAGLTGAETAVEIAQALGVEGEMTDRDGSWAVVDDGGRTVELYADGTATLGYVDPTLDPWACAVDASAESSPDELGSCDPAAAPTDPVSTAREFLTTLGVDTDVLRLEAGAEGVGAIDVTAYSDGAAAPAWTITVTAEGVYSAWGWLAPLVSLGSYDVVSPVVAVERLADPRFGAAPSGMVPFGAADGSVAEPSEPSGGPTTVPEPGATLPWPVETRTVVGAELTLVAYPTPGGATTLLPAWSLTTDDGGTWSVVAVTDEFLDFDAS